MSRSRLQWLRGCDRSCRACRCSAGCVHNSVVYFLQFRGKIGLFCIHTPSLAAAQFTCQEKAHEVYYSTLVNYDILLIYEADSHTQKF